MNEEPMFLAWGITWTLTCLLGFIASLNLPHQCAEVNCPHREREGGKK